MKKLLKNPKTIIFLALLILLGIVGIIVCIKTGITPSVIKSWMNDIIGATAERPILIYLAVIVTGGLPIPLSPVILLAGVTFKDSYGLFPAILICYSAMAISMIWTYFISAYPMRIFFEKIVASFADKFPEIPQEHKSKVALIIRITPGIPFFLQNYFLGVSRVPFVKYLIISLSIQAFYTTAFVMGGSAIFDGNFGLAITAISIFVVLIIAIQWLRNKNKTSKPENEAAA